MASLRSDLNFCAVLIKAGVWKPISNTMEGHRGADKVWLALLWQISAPLEMALEFLICNQMSPPPTNYGCLFYVYPQQKECTVDSLLLSK